MSRPWPFRAQLLAVIAGLAVLAVVALTVLWLALVRQQLMPSTLLSPTLDADLREAVATPARQAAARLQLISRTPELVNATFYHLVLRGEITHPRGALAALGRFLGGAPLVVVDRAQHPVAAWPEAATIGASAAGRLAAAIAGGQAAETIFLAADGVHWAGTAPLIHNELPIAAVVSEEILGLAFLRRLEGLTGRATVLVAPDGQVVVSSHPEVTPATRVADGQWLDTASAHLLPLLVPLTAPDHTRVCSLGILQPDLFAPFLRRSLPVVMATLAPFLLLALPLAWWSARHLSAPLKGLEEGARCIGAGDFAVRIPPAGSAEVAAVAGAFNRMAADLAKEIETRCQVERQAARNERLAAIGELAAGVAHQINNPLNNILGVARLVAEDDRLPAPLRPELEEIARHARRGSEVVRGLLGFAGRPIPRREPVDLATVASEVATALLPEARTRGVTVAVAANGATPVSADPVQLVEALTNLTRNAIQACRPGEGVVVEVTRRGTVVELAVDDNGVGVPPDLAERIFRPFFTTRQEAGGNGLGLAVAAQIVTAHGSTLRLLPGSRGRGSRFVATLPAESGGGGNDGR